MKSSLSGRYFIYVRISRTGGRLSNLELAIGPLFGPTVILALAAAHAEGLARYVHAWLSLAP